MAVNRPVYTSPRRKRDPNVFTAPTTSVVPQQNQSHAPATGFASSTANPTNKINEPTENIPTGAHPVRYDRLVGRNTQPIEKGPVSNISPQQTVKPEKKQETKISPEAQNYQSQIEELYKLNKALQEEYRMPVNQNDIRDSLGNVRGAIDQFGRPYNMEEDEIFKNISDNTYRQMLQQANNRGMAMSENTQARIGQAQSLLGLDFQQAHDTRNLQGIQNHQQYLNTLMGMNQQNYAMSRDALGDARYADETVYNRQMDTRNMETQTYGFELTGQTREFMDTFQNMTPEQRQDILQYDSNYAERMNQLDPNSEEYQALNSARFAKVLREFTNDPQTMGQYLINDYGLSPLQISMMSQKQGIDNLNAELSTIQQYYSDFQQEINNRMAQNPNDPMIPHLKIARAEKIAATNQAEMNHMEKLQKDAIELWKIMGVANEFVEAALGVPVGSQTSDFFDKQGRLAISEFNAQTSAFQAETSRLNYQDNSSHRAWQRRVEEAKQSASEEAALFLGEYFAFTTDPANEGKGFAEFMTEPLMDNDGNYVKDETGNNYMIYNRIGDRTANELLDMLVKLDRIGPEEASAMDESIAKILDAAAANMMPATGGE